MHLRTAIRLALWFALMMTSAICFMRYAGWAAAFSGWYGLSSKDWRMAQAHANLYWRGFIALEVFATLVLATLTRSFSRDSPRLLDYVARFGASAVASLIGTATLAIILSWSSRISR